MPPSSDPSGDPSALLLSGGWERFESWAGALPEPLSSAWRSVHRDWLQRVGSPQAHFLGPRATPAFVFLGWLAGVADEPALQASEALLATYFAARIQDDLVDDGASPDLAFLLQALTTRGVHLAARASGRPLLLLEHLDRLAVDFAAVALQDLALRKDPVAPWSEGEVADQGRKYLAIAGPFVALLLARGRDGDVERILATWVALSLGLQLTNDYYGAALDLDRGLGSPFLVALGLVPGLHKGHHVAPALLRGLRTREVDAWAGRIHAAFEQAILLSGDGAEGRFRRHVRLRRATLDGELSSQRLQLAFRSRRLVVDVEVTRRCNLSCGACFVKGRRAPAELPTETLLQVVDELGGYFAALHLTGGEPFLHPGLWAAMERMRQYNREEIQVNTNGTLLDPVTLSRLGQVGQVRLLVSLDGPEGVQETSRGPGTTRRVLTALGEAPGHGVEAQVAVLLTREMVTRGIGVFHKWICQEAGRQVPLVLWPMYLARGQEREQVPGSVLDPGSLREAAVQVADLLSAGVPVTVADFPAMNVHLARLGVPGTRLWRCGAGITRLGVHADGTVSPCHPSTEVLHHIRAGRVVGFVEDVLRSQPPEPILPPVCRQCGQGDGCGGCRMLGQSGDLGLDRVPLPCGFLFQ